MWLVGVDCLGVLKDYFLYFLNVITDGYWMTEDLPPTVILTTPTMMMVEIKRMTITTASVVPILASGESWESKVDRKVKNLIRIFTGNNYNTNTQIDNVVCPICCVSLYVVCPL